MNLENVNSRISTTSDDISLKELLLKVGEWWRYLLSKWIIVVGFGIIGGALGFLYAYMKKPNYVATTTFVLEDDKGGGGLGSLAGLASMAGVDLGTRGGGIFQGDNILELYRSRNMIEKTLLSYWKGNELLIERYITVNKLKENWAKRPELMKLQFVLDSLELNKPDVEGLRLRDSIIGDVVENIRRNYLFVSKPDKKLSIIRVDVKSKDELFAKSFNDILVKNVNEFYIQTKTKKSLENVIILQKKTDSVRNVMNGAIYSAVAVNDATPNLNPTRQIQRVAPAQKAQFSAETNKAVLSELVKNLEMSKISLLKETPLIQVVDQPIFPLTQEKLGKAKGLVIGGILFGGLMVFFLILRKVYRNILLND
ncbi:GumC domain-containing protein [Pedobacter africanus]|uniref:Chain length determinant protein n=1 Tax=Pedobacter africanus TaxID=151894 RepID=A0A1W2BT75_9SPHI|nr:lipopolysaccharide biosynthesis protein [Pedobacter africanus]SMC75778.1 Chain length determinant protein [Pedobacter africanus]